MSVIIDNEPNKINYFLLGLRQDNDKGVSAQIMQQLQKDFKDVFTEIGCFDGTFSLQVTLDNQPYQVLPRHVVYALKKPFKEELEWLQQQDIITLCGVDETVEWCSNFVFVLKPNVTVGVCLDLTRLNLGQFTEETHSMIFYQK